MRYVAFLRGINVGGHKLIRMEELRKMFVSLGFSDVKTYIQSGNIIFDSTEASSVSIGKKIKNGIYNVFGHDVEVFVLKIKQLQDIIKNNPFKKARPEEIKYMTFLPSPLKIQKLPILSQNKDVEMFLIKNSVVFSVSRKVKGKYGFPNGFVEKKFGVPATTRNWNTVKEIASYI